MPRTLFVKSKPFRSNGICFNTYILVHSRNGNDKMYIFFVKISIVNRGLKAKSMKEAFGAKRHERVVEGIFVGN